MPSRAPRIVWSPAPRRPARGWLHLLLAGASAITLAIAGGLWWDPPPSLRAPADLGQLAVLLDVLRAGASYAFWVLAILGAHEMGHYLACRRYGISATLPFFIPGPPPLGSFGAVIRIRSPIPHRRALFDVAAAGPLAGFAVAVPVMVAGVLSAEGFEPPDAPSVAGGVIYFGEPVLLRLLRWALGRHEPITMNALLAAGWVGALVTSLNLFPVGQLDGGHAAYAVSRRLHRGLTWVTLAGLVALVVGQAWWMAQVPAYMLWLGILLWMRDRHPRLLDERAPPGTGRVVLAAVLALVFILSFIPLPIRYG